MKLDRIMIAAPKSGSGKTTITCALLQALKDSDQSVVSYKCGPDYIDPMFHQKVIDIPSKNLDTFFTGEKETKALFLKDRRSNEIAVLEGVMGLYDGLGGIRPEGSSYHLAKITKTPIMLVIDAKGMGRSVIPVIAGFLNYDHAHLIKGVILNRMSGSYYEMIKPVIEDELHICVAGYFTEHKEFHIESRHLGLIMPGEIKEVKAQLQKAAEELQKTVSMEQILKIADEAEELEEENRDSIWQTTEQVKRKPVIAVAKDEAFCFYYEDNLRLLQEYGAELKYFSPIHDKKLPEGCNGILIGGGYPERYGERLSNNTDMRIMIKSAIQDGMPVVAECGGFMYLHSAIRDKEGHRYPMAGVIPQECCDTGKLVRFGYIELEDKWGSFIPEGETIKGHEFHYYDSADNGDSCIAMKPVTGRTYPSVIAGENCFIGFPHLYYPSNPVFAEKFVEKARKYQERKGQ